MTDSDDRGSAAARVQATAARRPRIGVHLWPGGVSDYRTWRQAVLDAEELGVDAIFGYDHFHRPFMEHVDGVLHLAEQHRGVEIPGRVERRLDGAHRRDVGVGA